MKVVVRGYYGFGNLGDDILMISSYNLIKQIFNDNIEIKICTDSSEPNYIKYLLPNVELIKSNYNEDFDLLIQGGGGVYFDFKDGGWFYGLLNKFINLIGFTIYKKIYYKYRKMGNEMGIRPTKRIGIGIGVGEFHPRSSKYYASILTLSDYDYLLVRDNESYNRVQKLKLKFPCNVSTDIAFSFKYPTFKGQRLPDGEKQIGFILRDWPYDSNNYISNYLPLADQLQKRGYKVKFYSFDSGDVFYENQVSGKYDLDIWNPYLWSMHEFLWNLSQNSIVISSRAHGAIISACLGIPGICIEIESKLKAVQQMLPNSYHILPLNQSLENTISMIENMLNDIVCYRSKVKKDITRNRNKLMKDIDILTENIF